MRKLNVKKLQSLIKDANCKIYTLSISFPTIINNFSQEHVLDTVLFTLFNTPHNTSRFIISTWYENLVPLQSWDSKTTSVPSPIISKPSMSFEMHCLKMMLIGEMKQKAFTKKHPEWEWEWEWQTGCTPIPRACLGWLKAGGGGLQGT